MIGVRACVRQVRHGATQAWRGSNTPMSSRMGGMGPGVSPYFLRTFSSTAPVDTTVSPDVSEAEEAVAATPAAAPVTKTFAKLKQFVGGGKLPEMDKSTDRTYEGVNLETQNLLGDAIKNTIGMDDAELADMERVASLLTASAKELQAVKIANTIKQYERFEGDTGSTEVQVAVLSVKIEHMVVHMASHRKDFGTKRRLQLASDKRRKLMKYLKGHRFSKYELMLRDFDMTEESIWEYQRLPHHKFFASQQHGINEWKGDDERRAKRLEILAAMAPAEELEGSSVPKQKKRKGNKGLIEKRNKERAERKQVYQEKKDYSMRHHHL